MGKKLKAIYLFWFILGATFIGCSNVYTLKQFPSRKKYYESFNDLAKTKDVKVTLTNDSSFDVSAGANILKDSLMLPNQYGKKNFSISMDKVKSINYKNRWLGMSSGFIVGFMEGAITGYLAGLILDILVDSNKQLARGGEQRYKHLGDQHVAALLGGAAFGVIGCIVGVIIGDNYTYIFNP